MCWNLKDNSGAKGVKHNQTHHPVYLKPLTDTVLFFKHNQTHHSVYLTPLTDTVLFFKHNQTHHPVYLTPLTDTVLFFKHNQTHDPVYLTPLTDTVPFFKHNQTHHPVYLIPLTDTVLFFKHNQTHHSVYITPLTDTVLFFKHNQTHHPVYLTPFRNTAQVKYILYVRPYNSQHKSLKQPRIFGAAPNYANTEEIGQVLALELDETLCRIGGSHSSVAEKPSLPNCYAVSNGKKLLAFRRIFMPSSSWLQL